MSAEGAEASRTGHAPRERRRGTPRGEGGGASPEEKEAEGRGTPRGKGGGATGIEQMMMTLTFQLFF